MAGACTLAIGMYKYDQCRWDKGEAPPASATSLITLPTM